MRASRVALTTVLTLALGATLLPLGSLAPADAAASAGTARFSPGSPGVGDRYFPKEGNGGYDVKHYGLRLAYDPDTHRLAGSNTITALAKQNLSRFDLDLSGYTVSSVTVGGVPATFRRSGQELVITPAEGVRRGSSFRTVVAYAGVPRTIEGSPIVFGAPYGWIYTKDGAFVGCEPNAARTWYPSNDHPSDKARFDFAVTVPSDRKVVANGDYRGRTVAGDQATYRWNERQPMATYLATIDIGRWQFHQTRTRGGIPQLTAVDPSLAKQARHQHTIGVTSRITDYWAKTFGRYPFSSTGGIVDNVPDIGFSLETQTRPLYGFVPDPGTASHELAHEWFGDSVSVRSWKHIWLNEGFATFAAMLWTEHTGGRSTYRQARGLYRQIPASDPFWHQAIAAPGRNQMFSGAVYERGAMTLAALRHRIGHRDFLQVLRRWARVHHYGNVGTGQFTALAHRVSGERLGHFFHVWLYRKAKPGHF